MMIVVDYRSRITSKFPDLKGEPGEKNGLKEESLPDE
jgi:hypothetical protein